MNGRAVASVTVIALTVACGGDILAPTAPSRSIAGVDGRVAAVDAPDFSEFGWTTSNTGRLAALSIDPSVYVGGESTRGTITLHEPAPESGLALTVTADDTAATVPSTVTVAQGATTASFTITTRAVSSDIRIRVTVSVGTSSLTVLMRITPLITVKSLTVEHTSITGGLSTIATVTLSAVNTGGNTAVTLESEKYDVRVPSSITIASGSTTGTFTVQTRDVSAAEEAWLHARVGTTARQSIQLRLIPNGGSGSQQGLTLGARID